MHQLVSFYILLRFFTVFPFAVCFFLRNFAARIIEVRVAAIKREWGENPQLSRSCKFLYSSHAVNPLPAFAT